MSDWNTQIIDEFRSNGGRVGGPFEGRPLLLLHHCGARTGTWRVSPLVYLDLGGSYAVFASKAGAPTNPDWFHNVRAHPETHIEIGELKRAVRARITQGEERQAIWERQKQALPMFAEYEAKTDRVIPVIVLDPIEG